MTDDELDRRMREAARGYHQPPATPRDAMWDVIRRQRAPAPAPAPRAPRWDPRHWLPLAAAALVILAAGVGLGRISSGGDTAAPPPAAPVAAERAAPDASAAYRLAARDHLGQSEVFLTLFRSSVAPDADHRLASATARRLLASNRLLLDSPAAADRRTRLLLEDLELVLAGIAQLSPGAPAQDLELIREGLERRMVMPRIRSAVPAGSTPTQGVL